jgi:hypothetical protein
MKPSRLGLHDAFRAKRFFTSPIRSPKRRRNSVFYQTKPLAPATRYYPRVWIMELGGAKVFRRK